MDIFQSNFLMIAFISAVLSAASTALLSVFISLKKISYMGEALAHVSFAGIAFALLTSLNLNLTVLIFVTGIALVIGFISRHNHMDESNITTIFLSVSMAIAIILIRLNKDYTIDLAGYLFGNILLVTATDTINLGILLAANTLFLIFFFKEIFYTTYNLEMAKVFRIPVTLIYYLFLVFLAVNIVITVKIVGIILITAQMILPGITALNFSRKIGKAILMSILISETASICGFFIAHYMNIPSGATIVIMLFILFLFSLIKQRLMSYRKQEAGKIN